MDHTVRLWDCASGKNVKTLTHPPSTFLGIQSVSWSPDGKRVASGDSLGVVRIWDPLSRKLLHTIQAHEHPIGTLIWSPDGKRLLSSVEDARIWDMESGKLLHIHPGGAVAWSLNGRFLAWNEAGILRFREAATGRLHASVYMWNDDCSLVLTPTGHYRASPSIEGDLVYIVQTDLGRETLTPAEFEKKYGWKNNPNKVRLCQ
jgi:WD40 repeat protein